MRAKFSPASNKLISAEFIFDTTNIATQLGNIKTRSSEKRNEVAAAAAAAQVAAHAADALLDSIQMPAFNDVPAAITVGGKHESHTCVTCSESSDESTTDLPSGSPEGVVTRRVSTRQKH